MTIDSPYNSFEQITARASKVYLANQHYLKESLAETYIVNFLQASPKYSSNLDQIVSVLDSYMNDENINAPSLHFNAVNNVLLTLENEQIARNIGYEKISTANGVEYLGDGETVNTLQALVGGSYFTSVIADGDSTLTGLLGNTPLPSFVVFNQIYQPKATITEQLDLYTKVFSKAIGTASLNINPNVNLYSCESSDILGSQVYATSSNPSLSEAINAIYSCSIWSSSPEYIGLIDINHDNDCTSSISIEMFNDCISKFGAQNG